MGTAPDRQSSVDNWNNSEFLGPPSVRILFWCQKYHNRLSCPEKSEWRRTMSDKRQKGGFAGKSLCKASLELAKDEPSVKIPKLQWKDPDGCTSWGISWGPTLETGWELVTPTLPGTWKLKDPKPPVTTGTISDDVFKCISRCMYKPNVFSSA